MASPATAKRRGSAVRRARSPQPRVMATATAVAPYGSESAVWYRSAAERMDSPAATRPIISARTADSPAASAISRARSHVATTSAAAISGPTSMGAPTRNAGARSTA